MSHQRPTTPSGPPDLDAVRALVAGSAAPDSPTASSVLARWRASWATRHTVAAVALAPLLYRGYQSAADSAAALGQPGWVIVLALISMGAAITYASYLPAPGTRDHRGLAGTPCAAAAGMFPVAAAMALATAGLAAGGVVALGLVAMGLSQRIIGTVACPTN
jgi:hypothetical protein